MNQKAGVGKTTTASNLAHALALEGKSVTILDMDPQGEIAKAYGLNNEQKGLDKVLLEELSIDEVVITVRENLDIVLAGQQLTEFENIVTGGVNRARKLQQAIEKSALRTRDYVLIDSPVQTGLLGLNVMIAADEIIVPAPSDFLSLQGLSKMFHIFKRVESLSGRSMKLWLVSTRINLQSRLAREARERLLSFFPNRLFKTVIRESSLFAESLSMGKTIFDYKQDSTGAEDYQSLAKDLLQGRMA